MKFAITEVPNSKSYCSDFSGQLCYELQRDATLSIINHIKLDFLSKGTELITNTVAKLKKALIG